MLFVSSFQYVVDFHFCKGELKSFSLIGKAKNCHEVEKERTSCNPSKSCASSCSSKDKNCCSNETVVYQNEFDDKIIQDRTNTKTLNVYLTTFSQVEVQKSFVFSEALIPYRLYKPPILYQDIPILFESLLI